MALDTLSLIAETVASLLGDSVKNRLKPKTSADIAKAKALQLYQVLGKIDEETTFYIKNFETYLSTFASGESKESLEPLKEELKSSVIKIWELIERLQKALDNINPQLEIHNHELVKNIITFRGERMGILATQTMNYGNNLIQDTPAKKSHDKKVQINRKKILEIENVIELRKILSKVKSNQKSIKKIIEEFRKFISSEFSFKDSF